MEERNLYLQSEVKRYVNGIRQWYKFFAVLSIVGVALTVLLGVAMLVFGNLMNDIFEERGVDTGMPIWVLGIVYIAVAAAYVPMIIYLFKAARAARNAIALNNNEAARMFIRQTRNFWKYSGILTIVMLGLFGVVFPGAIIAAIALAL